MAYLLFRTQSATIATAAGTTFTHGLSRSSANLDCLITMRSTTTLSIPFLVGTVGVNTVVLGATGANAIVDFVVIEWHSAQGGPT